MEKPVRYEEITPKRLWDFRTIIKEYITLLRHKKNLIERIGILRSVDYSKDRVQSGNVPKTSEQERYAMKLERINYKIAEYKAWIPIEVKIIRNQLERIRNRENAKYLREIIEYRYLGGWKFSKITELFFGLEDDFEEQQFDKYKDKTMRWHREALQELETLNKQPYVPIVNQLHIQEFHY